MSATSLTESPTISLVRASPVCSANSFVLEMVSGFFAAGFVVAAAVGFDGGAGDVVEAGLLRPGCGLAFGTGTVPGDVCVCEVCAQASPARLSPATTLTICFPTRCMSFPL